jgi:hypothetical protein
VEKCLAGYVKTPKGKWTVSMMADLVAKYQARELRLESCLEEVALFYKALQTGLAKRR